MGNRVRHWLSVGVCGAMFSAMLLAGTAVVSADGTSDNDSPVEIAQQDGISLGTIQVDSSGDMTSDGAANGGTASDGTTSDAP